MVDLGIDRGGPPNDALDGQLMPTFFVNGAAKSGTTSLHYYLDRHPEISMASFKEPAYFVREPIYRQQVSDREAYRSLFESGTRHRGESSVTYTQWPVFGGVPMAIRDEVPDARFVYLVRDPVERARSHYVQARSSRSPHHVRHFRGESLERAFTDLDPAWNTLVAAGLYMTQIRQYLEFFPRESILVVDSDDLRLDRRSTLDRICDFLELDPMPSQVEFEDERNPAEGKFQEAQWYVRLTEAPSLRQAVDLLPGGVREGLVSTMQRTVSRPLDKPEFDPETRERLESVFREEVEELREFTGQAFPGWSI